MIDRKVASKTRSEQLDIVDKNNVVIGTADRCYIHKHKLHHRSTHIWLESTAGEVLIQKRSMLKDEAPGLWDSSCAGHVDAGETYKACAVRELKEELGIDVSALKAEFLLPAASSNYYEFCQVYSLTHDGPFLPDPIEVADIKWVTKAELANMVIKQASLCTDVLIIIAQNKLNLTTPEPGS